MNVTLIYETPNGGSIGKPVTEDVLNNAVEILQPFADKLLNACLDVDGECVARIEFSTDDDGKPWAYVAEA